MGPHEAPIQNETPITLEQLPETQKQTVEEERSADAYLHHSAEEFNTLGWFHLEQFRSRGALYDLSKAVKWFTRAVSLAPNSDSDLSHWLTNLGVACNDQFEWLGELADLEESIKYITRALSLTADGDSDVSVQHSSSGMPHNRRYRRLGKFIDLEKGIQDGFHTLGSTHFGHPSMANQPTDLGAFVDRYRRPDELADLKRAFECDSRALALTSGGHIHMAIQHENTELSYVDRYRYIDGFKGSKKSTESGSRALEIVPHGHPSIADRHAGLGVSYGHRYRRIGQLADLEKAIEHSSHAVALAPEECPHISHWHANLGVSYLDLYRHLGKLEDLEKAIESRSRALALTLENHPDISCRHAELGVSYNYRYSGLGELSDLEKAIEYHSHALALTPEDHPDILRRYTGLVVSYSHRYHRLDELTDLEKAIEYASRALALTPNGHPDRSRQYAILGLSYTDRYQRLGELTDLEKAIEFKSRALVMTHVGQPRMSRQQLDPKLSYIDRFEHQGNLGGLEKVTKRSSRSLLLTRDDHPDMAWRHFSHALYFFQEYQRTTLALHLNTSLISFRRASQLLARAPRDRFQYAFYWANLASEYIALNPMEAYQATIDLLPQFIWLGTTTKQRYHDLSLAKCLSINACYAAIQESEYSRALQWLEHARCVVWNQSLMLRSPLDQLSASHPDLALQLNAVANELQDLSFEAPETSAIHTNLITPERAGQRRCHLASKYNDLLIRTRQLPGFENFLRPIKTHELIPVVRNGPFVVINCHTYCCDALILLPGCNRPTHLRLSNFNEAKARRARSELDMVLKQKHLRRRGVKAVSQPGYKCDIGGVLEELWIDIVKPILKEIGYMDGIQRESLPHITWCLAGSLSFLPLHAAGDYSQPGSKVFDYVISSYTPTLTALLASPPNNLNRNCRVLAISQVATPGRTLLPGTAKELAYIKAHTYSRLGYSELVGSEATTVSVLEEMERHDWVHFACHANQDADNPTKSGFFLHDGTLDLSEISRRSFKNKGLAFLSACQTATGDEKLPDEAIHLASGMLMAGYSSVIATMWSVVDEDAPFVADKVYARLMKDGKLGNGEAGRALHDAVAGLRQKVGEEEFGRWVPYIHIGS